MTEKRLAYLLDEATDLVPSEALRTRVESLAAPSRRRPWLALSGATVALAVASFALIPRPGYAEGLLNRAVRNEASVSARIRSYAFVDGAWRLDRSGIVAGAWSRFDERGGGVQLDTPDGSYRRSGADGTVFQSEAKPWTDDGSTLAAHLRFLKRLGYRTTVAAGPKRQENGRTVQDVTIDMAERRERETITMDIEDELPLCFLSEAKLAGGWTPTVRTEAAYPGPQPGSPEFWAGIDRRRIVSVGELTALWTRRLAPVRETLRLSGGAALEVRDLRVLPSGDVVALYTGPGNLFARLEGEDGARFGRVWFDPNDGRTIPRSRPPIVLGGKPLRGLWFAPLEEGARAKGRMRLTIEGGPEPRSDQPSDLNAPLADAKGQRGAFLLTPMAEEAEVPAWADAIDNGFLKGNLQGERDNVRLTAAYDQWLDAEGKSVEGTFQFRPRAGWWIPDGPPRPGLRHDPKASAAAAEAFRTMMAHAKARGWGINPTLVESYLPRFEREARGE